MKHLDVFIVAVLNPIDSVVDYVEEIITSLFILPSFVLNIYRVYSFCLSSFQVSCLYVRFFAHTFVEIDALILVGGWWAFDNRVDLRPDLQCVELLIDALVDNPLPEESLEVFEVNFIRHFRLALDLLNTRVSELVDFLGVRSHCFLVFPRYLCWCFRCRTAGRLLIAGVIRVDNSLKGKPSFDVIFGSRRRRRFCGFVVFIDVESTSLLVVPSVLHSLSFDLTFTISLEERRLKGSVDKHDEIADCHEVREICRTHRS